jgi:hypothetical protein
MKNHIQNKNIISSRIRVYSFEFVCNISHNLKRQLFKSIEWKVRDEERFKNLILKNSTRELKTLAIYEKENVL